MSNHESFVRLATKLINKHGRNVELITATQFGDQWDPGSSHESITVKAVNTQFSSADKLSGLVKEGDRQYLVDSSVPITHDMKLRDGSLFSVVDFDEVKPGDQSILFKVHVRG